MSKRTKHDLLRPDVFDVLSATWVFACNDENPIITYRGLEHRLGTNKYADIKRLIRARGDLFRQGVPKRRLEKWKEEMMMEKHLPRWIAEIEDNALRQKAIKELTEDDVFRSQFRTGDEAPKSSLQVVDWGLQYIDRLRHAGYEARERSAKSWQMWLVFGVGLLNIAATIISALLKHS